MAKRFNVAEKQINRFFAKDSMISDELLEDKIRSFSKLSMSYFMLLTGSVIIATLGLLMNASAIVIGSMIISPLTWPMFGLADGAALGNRKRIKANLYILIASVTYGILLAYILTVFSPLKVVNSEILARSTPTLLDAVVALTAGAIGIIAVVRKNISDTIAGVAVALSLTPPLCVVGISLALGELDLVKGSFLLLTTNALSITLVAGLILVLVHYSWRRKLHMAPKAFIIMLFSLLITAVPLYRLLSVYSLESSSYAVVQTELDSYVKNISQNGSVQNIRTNLESKSGEDVLVIDADIFLPSSFTITYEDKDKIVSNLSDRLDRVVDLRLRVQSVSLLSSSEDISKQNTIKRISEDFSTKIAEISTQLKINDIDVSENQQTWTVISQISGGQSQLPDEVAINKIAEQMQSDLNLKISINVSFVPISEIKTEKQNKLDSLKSKLQSRLSLSFSSAEITSMKVNELTPDNISKVDLEVKISDTEEITPELAIELKELCASSLQTGVELKIRLVKFNESVY